MRSLYFPLLTVLMILFAGFFWFSDAAAGENTCMFKADSNKVHITVWDEDSGEDRQGKIFEGALESGDRQKIQSTTGFIVFSYKLAGDDRSYGDNHQTCKNGKTIRVP